MEYERRALEQPLYRSVNVYRIGDTLVDTGHVAKRSRMELRAAHEDRVSRSTWNWSRTPEAVNEGERIRCGYVCRP